MMKKFILKASLLFGAGILWSQSYTVTIETSVGNKTEDKIVFNMAVGDEQKKGFDAKMSAKRYRGEGFPNKVLERVASEKKENQEDANRKSMLLLDKAKISLSEMRSQKSQIEYSLESSRYKIDDLDERIKILERIVDKGEKKSGDFKNEYAAYVDKYQERESEADIEYKKLARRRPRNTGDVDEIDVGSYCDIKIEKGNDKAVSVNLNYAYSRQLSFFYSDANNNGNMVTKHPIFERFEKYGVKNLVLKIGETYCYQFGRRNSEEARSLQDALNSSTLLGGMDSGGVSAAIPQMPPTEFDDEGTLSEIRKKHSAGGSKTVRVMITVKAAK